MSTLQALTHSSQQTSHHAKKRSLLYLMANKLFQASRVASLLRRNTPAQVARYCGSRKSNNSSSRGATSVSRREVHVEAHLDAIGVKLPVAIVPPQGNGEYTVAEKSSSHLRGVIMRSDAPRMPHRLVAFAYSTHDLRMKSRRS